MNKQSSSYALSIGRLLFWGFVLMALYAINQASGNNLIGAFFSAIQVILNSVISLIHIFS